VQLSKSARFGTSQYQLAQNLISAKLEKPLLQAVENLTIIMTLKKLRYAFFHRVLRSVILFVMAIALSIATAQPGAAQFAFPSAGGAGSIVGPPLEVVRYGNMETIAVKSPLSNRNLFTIASPTVYNRSADALADQLPVEQRAKEIQAKLLLLLQRDIDPESLMFGVSQLNNVTIITVRDDQYPQPLVLASITANDAEFNGLPREELAELWREILETELRDGLRKLPQDRQRVYAIVAGLLLITGIVVVLKYFLSRYRRRLKQQQPLPAEGATDDDEFIEAEPTTPREEIEQQRAESLQKLQQEMTVGRRLATIGFIQWLLFWLLILAWYGGVVLVFDVSPYLLTNSLGFLDVVLGLLTVWFITSLAIRASRRLIDYLSVEREGLDIGDFLTYGDAQRRQIRVNTIAGALKGLITILLALVGFLLALSQLGLPTASVVAIGSLAGLAITFGSQNLVKDLVNGFFILAEDQYAVGDVIDVGTAAGLVEDLNMRVTQIRSSDGELVTVPNSTITQVKNLTRSWSRIAFQIDVAYQTNPRVALQVLKDLSEKFYNDTKWHDLMVAEPEVLGIDSVTHSGMTITVWIRTQPAQQWAVGREFRLRVREAMEAHGIEIGMPKQSYQLEPPSTSGQGPSSELFEVG
jgi:small-conductance mechanosensitive channel